MQRSGRLEQHSRVCLNSRRRKKRPRYMHGWAGTRPNSVEDGTAKYAESVGVGGGREGRRGCTHVMHRRSRMNIDPRILTMPGGTEHVGSALTREGLGRTRRRRFIRREAQPAPHHLCYNEPQRASAGYSFDTVGNGQKQSTTHAVNQVLCRIFVPRLRGGGGEGRRPQPHAQTPREIGPQVPRGQLPGDGGNVAHRS